MPKRVLVVDDNEEITGMLETVLSNEGFEVLLTGSAEQGREACHEHMPDVAIIDYMMSGEIGITLAKELTDRQVPTIVYTAFPNHALQQEVEAFGAKFIAKTSVRELLNQVQGFFNPTT